MKVEKKLPIYLQDLSHYERGKNCQFTKRLIIKGDRPQKNISIKLLFKPGQNVVPNFQYLTHQPPLASMTYKIVANFLLSLLDKILQNLPTKKCMKVVNQRNI